MNIHYNNINNFLLVKDDKYKYLFFDIFCRNGELIIICPVYEPGFCGKYNTINHNDIRVFCQDIELEKIRTVTNNNPWEATMIIIYSNIFLDNILNITVAYEDMTKNYILKNENLTMDYNLTQTTLFKNDYRLIKFFYNYYTNHGIDFFYMYYNRSLNDNVINICKNKNILLIEWEYHYWNYNSIDNDYAKTYNHHAQIGQIQHALYKYCKPTSKYTLYNDLDEYIYLYGNKIIDYIDETKYDFYRFTNFWAMTLNDGKPKKFPTKIKRDKNQIDARSKCIYLNEKIDLVNIHFPKYDISKLNYIFLDNKDGYMIHFCNWTNGYRIIDDYDEIDL